jgi:hypothetical protein
LRCFSLNEIIFPSDPHRKQISGFCEYISLSRIEIPSSLEIIDCCGFWKCSSLNEISLASDSHLKKISGFCECISLSRIEIPSSIEKRRLQSVGEMLITE